MTADHLNSLLSAAEAKKDDQGWFRPPDGRSLTLYVGADGVSLTVGRVEALKVEGDLVKARTVKSEVYIVALQDVFAGAVDAPAGADRKAGFV
jgi:hypothetical protein